MECPKLVFLMPDSFFTCIFPRDLLFLYLLSKYDENKVQAINSDGSQKIRSTDELTSLPACLTTHTLLYGQVRSVPTIPVFPTLTAPCTRLPALTQTRSGEEGRGNWFTADIRAIIEASTQGCGFDVR